MNRGRRSYRFEDLCHRARRHGLFVELMASPRGKDPLPADSPPPCVDALRITDVEKKVVFETSATLPGLDRAAEAALKKVSP